VCVRRKICALHFALSHNILNVRDRQTERLRVKKNAGVPKEELLTHIGDLLELKFLDEENQVRFDWSAASADSRSQRTVCRRKTSNCAGV
jgi:hypothetical protein